MRTLLVVTLLLAAGLPSDLLAQAPSTATPSTTAPEKGSWELVQAIPPGTKLRIKFTTGAKSDCHVTKIDADTLSCDSTAVFKRADIVSIRTEHRLRSTLIAFGLGYFAAGGILAIAAAGDPSVCNNFGCAVAVVLTALAVLIAAPIVGHYTDFTASTVYKVPETSPPSPKN